MLMNKLRFRGDTIIEVLISITVVSVILGGAYASSNRSLSATRQAQERGESLKLAEKQLELLKTVTRVQPAVLNETEPFFCIHEDLTYTKYTSMPNLHEFDEYEECAQQPHGGTEYFIGVERTSEGSFIIHSTWYRANGQGDDELNLIYRIYPSSTVPVTAPPCPGSPGCGVPPPPPPPTSEPSVNLTTDKGKTPLVDPGDRVELIWTTSNGPFEYCDAEASFEQTNHRNWNGRLDEDDVAENGGEERTGDINDRTTFRIECWKDGVRKRDSVTVRVRSPSAPSVPGPSEPGNPATPGTPGDVCGVSTYFAHPGPIGHGHDGGDAVGGSGGDGSGGDACTGDAGDGGDGGSSAPGGDGRPSAPSAPGAGSSGSGSSSGTICSTRNGVETCTDL